MNMLIHQEMLSKYWRVKNLDIGDLKLTLRLKCTFIFVFRSIFLNNVWWFIWPCSGSKSLRVQKVQTVAWGNPLFSCLSLSTVAIHGIYCRSCRVLNMPTVVSVCPQSSPSFCVFSSSLPRVILSFVLSSAFHSDRSSIVQISFRDLSFGNYVVRKPPDLTVRKLVYGHSTVSYVSMKWPPCPDVTFLSDVTPLTMTNAALQYSKGCFH